MLLDSKDEKERTIKIEIKNSVKIVSKENHQ